MSPGELVALVCCDLGAIVRGRSLPASELAARGDSGVGWVPANQALTPIGPLAEPNPFGSTGDLRLLPDPTRTCASRRLRSRRRGRLEFVLCDIVETDGQPWECCPRSFLRDALAELLEELGLRLIASFEHEFQLLSDAPAALPFSLEAQRRAEPFPSEVMGALHEAGVAPERFMRSTPPTSSRSRWSRPRDWPPPTAPSRCARSFATSPAAAARAPASRRCSTPRRRATACTSISA